MGVGFYSGVQPSQNQMVINPCEIGQAIRLMIYSFSVISGIYIG